MPNRYIRESAIESERVNALSWHGEVFYRRLLNRADDFGRFTANPALLRASIFPLQLDKVSEKDAARLLAEAEACGLLGTYGVEGKRFLVLSNWEKGRANKSRYPEPPAELCERLQTYVYTCEQASTDVPDSDTDSDTDSDPDTDMRGNSRERVSAGRKQFVPPTREELDLEAAKIGLPPEQVDAFAAYYGANGWRVGRNPMKSWPHALAGWAARWRERNHANNNGNRGGGHGGSAADQRRSLVSGADAVQRQAEESARQDRELVESGRLPL